jgi:hypothetical protein
VAGAARSFLALPAGGALAVVAPPENAPPGFQNAWVIDGDGVLEAAAPIEGLLTQPVLFGGAGGAPVLWTGSSTDGSGTPGRWLRWQPWEGAFGALTVLDDVPAHVGPTTASGDPGLALWMDVSDPAAVRLTGLRFDVRGAYSPLAGPLLVSDANDVAPDRLARAGVASFDTTTGLVLGPGTSAFVTDRTYADVRIEADTPNGVWIVLRDSIGHELEVGGASCPVTGAGPATWTVERHGPTVTWNTGAASGRCDYPFAADARLTLGLRGPGDGNATARNLRITRLTEAL